MPGSMTEEVPDYRDPNAEARRLLSSRKRSDREKGKELLQLMEQQQNRQVHEREFNERAADRRSAEEGRRSEAQSKQEQLNLYREGRLEDQANRGEDRRSAQLNTLLADSTTPDAVKQSIQAHLLGKAGVSATLPVDPKVAALARSKGLPEPQGKVLGGAPTTAPEATLSGGSSPRGAFVGNLAPGSQNQYPVLPNTPEPRFVPLGHGPLEGSNIVKEGIQTPSGGFIGTELTPGVKKLIGREESKPQFGATQPDAFRGHGAGSSFGEDVGIGDIVVGKPVPQQPTTPTTNVAGEAFKRTNQKLGDVGQSLEPFTIAKNAIGSLFGGGQGGASEIVNQPQTNPTPAPGTQFQGPITATAGFIGGPNAPTPIPANTPPAIPPVNKLTPEEERRRLAGQQ